MMRFSRKEFNREAGFYAVGGVRGSLTWEDFCDLKLPIPPLSRQREIVAEYETLTRRIRLNKRLISSLESAARMVRAARIGKQNIAEGSMSGAGSKILMNNK